MNNDTQKVVSQLTSLHVASRRLVEAVEALQGVQIPYPDAIELATSCDVVRVLLGDESKLARKDSEDE